jgi:hypothetical protein
LQYTAPLSPIILSISSPPAGMATSGGETIVLHGQDFAPPMTPCTALFNATYGNGIYRPYTAQACICMDAQTITCLSAPGFGANMVWNVSLLGYPVQTAQPIVNSYAPPVISSVVPDVSPLSTGGTNQWITISGTNLGGPLAFSSGAVSITYGSANQFQMTPKNVTHFSVRAILGEGCGNGNPVTVTVGAQPSTSSNVAATQISFPAPSITAITVPLAASYTPTTLANVGGQSLVLQGTNLGPAFVQGSPLLPAAVYANAMYSYAVTCTKSIQAAAHTQMSCITAPGVGASFAWTVNVCGQTSVLTANITSYAPPVITSISGPGSLDATTEGGQAVTVTGSNLGVEIFGVPSSSIIQSVVYGKPGVLQFTAESCSVSYASTSLTTLACLSAPGTGRGHAWQVA